MLKWSLPICVAMIVVSTSSIAEEHAGQRDENDQALRDLQIARADLIANIKQLRAIQTYQEALQQSDGALMETRLVPSGLCAPDMAHLCALFPVTFGIWGTN
ncbi:hypothetical protein [Yoonia sp. R2-816]|uniref:hypothetical protein n=1 Tax=Yoonia sp. R2-816 TaxID=3342638 RepID=UPI003728CA48